MSARRALLIGCVADDLPGVAESVEAMAGLLATHRFATRTLVGAEVTASAIHRAFLDLFAQAGPGDAVVVYYAGHGSVFRDAPRDGRGKVRVPLIAATDLHDSELDDLRGLLGSELSRLIRALSAVTDNITVILDCCHAADFVRPDDLGLDLASTRAYEAELRRAVAHRVRQVARGPADAPGAGPRAVVLAGSASNGKSFPDPARKILLFTDHLIRALEPAGDRPRQTWQEIVLLIRARLQRVRRAQLPGVAGARFRFPFSTDLGLPGPGFHVGHVRDRVVTLDTGALAGFSPGDRFELVVFGWGEKRRGSRVAEAVARVVEPERAELRIDRITADGRLPEVVHVRRLDGRRLPLALDPAAAAALRPGAPADELFPGWELRDAGAVARVIHHGGLGAVDVHDHDGELVARVRLTHPAAHARVNDALARVARWWGLARALESAALPALGDCFAAYWGVLRQPARGGPPVEELLDDDARVPARAAMFLRIENTGLRRSIYARAYRIRADRAIVPWEDSEHATGVGRGESDYLGRDSAGPARHVTLDWPDEELSDMPGGTCLKEWALLVLSNGPISRDIIPSDEPAADGRTTRGAQRFAAIPLPYRLEFPG